MIRAAAGLTSKINKMEIVKNKKGEFECKSNIIERMVILNAIPQNGGRVEIVINRSIEKKLEPTLDEIKQFEIKTNSGAVTMNIEGTKHVIQYTLAKIELKRIVEGFEAQDKKKELMENGLKIWETIEKVMPKEKE